MSRREFMTLLLGSGVVAWSFAARAQQKAMPVIGFLGFGGPDVAPADWAAFRQGLSETGYVEGQNLVIEYRWSDGRVDRLPALVTELVSRKVDVIVVWTSAAALAAKNTTSAIPIVFVATRDPVAGGLVASLARPGGNLTGISVFDLDLMPKRLELLSELVPPARAIALLADPNSPITEPMIRDVEEAARTKGVQLVILKAGTESEIDAAFATLAKAQVGGLFVGSSVFLFLRRQQIAALASRYAVPSMYDAREYVVEGGLISYAPRFAAVTRQLGIYAGRILKGEKPADLPVQQPTTFELVINLKTAKALGLTVPQALVARADEVIE